MILDASTEWVGIGSAAILAALAIGCVPHQPSGRAAPGLELPTALRDVSDEGLDSESPPRAFSIQIEFLGAPDQVVSIVASSGNGEAVLEGAASGAPIQVDGFRLPTVVDFTARDPEIRVRPTRHLVGPGDVVRLRAQRAEHPVAVRLQGPVAETRDRAIVVATWCGREPQSEVELARATSDGHGLASARLFSPCDSRSCEDLAVAVWVLADRRHELGGWRRISVDEPSALVEVPLELQPTSQIQVQTGGGCGGTVRAFPSAVPRVPRTAPLLASAPVGADGSVALAVLPGEYVIESWCNGRRTASAEDVRVRARSSTAVELSAPSPSLLAAGRLFGEMDAAEGRLVVVLQDGVEVGRGVSGSDGRFECWGEPSVGPVRVVPDPIRGQFNPPSRVVDAGDRSVSFDVGALDHEDPVLALELPFAPNRAPAEVCLWNGAFPGILDCYASHSGETVSLGAWVAPGTRISVATASGYWYGSVEEAGAERLGRWMRLSPAVRVGAPIWVAVTDDSGEPISGARVHLGADVLGATDEFGIAVILGAQGSVQVRASGYETTDLNLEPARWMRGEAAQVVLRSR